MSVGVFDGSPVPPEALVDAVPAGVCGVVVGVVAVYAPFVFESNE